MNIDKQTLRPIWLHGDLKSVMVIDQRRLPHEFVVADLQTVDDIVMAIQEMFVRGAPLIGVTGNLVHWMLTAQWADHMARRGEMPYFYPPLHEEGKRKYWKIMKELYSRRGY